MDRIASVHAQGRIIVSLPGIFHEWSRAVQPIASVQTMLLARRHEQIAVLAAAQTASAQRVEALERTVQQSLQRIDAMDRSVQFNLEQQAEVLQKMDRMMSMISPMAPRSDQLYPG